MSPLIRRRGAAEWAGKLIGIATTHQMSICCIVEKREKRGGWGTRWIYSYFAERDDEDGMKRGDAWENRSFYKKSSESGRKGVLKFSFRLRFFFSFGLYWMMSDIK